MEALEGHLEGRGCQFGIVISKFNEMITARLLASAEATFIQLGTSSPDIQVFYVPGAFEIPVVAKALAQSGRFDAIVCLGAVIRGETPHFDYICAEASRGIGFAALQTGVPIVFGILTTDTVEQAMERSGTSERNKGADAARTAVEMATLMKKIGEKHQSHVGFHH